MEKKEQPIIIPVFDHPLKFRIENYCAYQERSQYEVRQKLYEWKAYPNDVEELIANLITSNFLNEERFAIAFAGGKFRILNWGRKKIQYGLKLKQISSYCIQIALRTIDEDEYVAVLQKVLRQKLKNFESASPLQKKKLALFAQQRGFESELIWKLLKETKQ